MIAGAEIDTSTVGNYIVTYNVQDPAGNSAKEITRLVSVVQAPASRPAIKSLVVDGNKVTITLVTPDGVYDHWRVLISEESFNENLPLEGVIIKPGLEFTSPALASGTHQIHLAFADDKSLIIGESISTQVVILNTSGKKVQVTYGTASSGESGSIFSDSNGIGFSAGEPGIAAYGFFTPGYDIERGAARGDMNEMLSNFNPLAWSNFNDAISPGFFLKTVEHFENGVGEVPYILTLKDVSDIVDANNASEFGLFTDTALPSIPKGESPFPKDYPIERYRFDTVLLGREIPGKGSGPDGDKGPAFATQEVVEDTGVPIIALLGDKDIAMEPGLPIC